MSPSDWYLSTYLGDLCTSDTHCKYCQPGGDCDRCDTIDGRFIEAVSNYASTCDGCGELTGHNQMTIDTQTQSCYCPKCVSKLPDEIRVRLEL